MSDQVEKIDLYKTVVLSTRGSTVTMGYRKMSRRVANVYFGTGMHPSLIPYVMDVVKMLGLEDAELVVGRRSLKTLDSSKGQCLGAHMPAVPEANAPPSVWYDRRLKLSDRTTETPATDEQISVIHAALLHELMHLRYPKASEETVIDLMTTTFRERQIWFTEPGIWAKFAKFHLGEDYE